MKEVSPFGSYTTDSPFAKPAKEDICQQCKELPAGHTIWQHGNETRLCCRCYVTTGHPPADWHRLCMVTYGLLKGYVQAEEDEA